ncbi:D-alanyl-D-alanine carboxypeptidase family protein [Streptomyces griseoloalbus]|uniref:D-alanyl-D-alanine carboxypeptidase (Penicillin-binding protein 5/6) n=1 Tax=Streptomyces griseoloalbus TaxID=67303 RepID=A0A7W8BKJ0_9ACTN|nr:D-alanyl-D-alanine carboxypeptidase [Streptomyces albaduncus]MBB5125122.1 D-alanyl-D-alanine carboxypeptidase (penicillin-binding protein 5/6) [Streptomyces albaduncus]GGW30000.1 D-alanyl-D-alanine carboxypeptidase [Streptomyces albaduncus]
MTIGFASRAAVSTGALCTAGLLALAPAAATTGTGIDPGPRATAAPASLLYRHGTHVRPRPGAPEVPDLSALSWLVADAGTGDVLAAHDAHRRLPPASTLKTLFALTVVPVLPAGIRHRVSEKELAGIGTGSSLVGVAENRAYRVSDLWNGVFLNSGNDAVRVLAALSGGWRATAERMQEEARALGARDTRVKSPDGYDAPGQVSSAYDLAVFGRAGLRNPEFARYCARAAARFPDRDGGFYVIRNTNRLLTGADGVEPYRGLIGIKNGYTSHAGHTLVAAARRGGRTLVVSVMNPRSGGGHTVYEEARSLLDWGFDATGRVHPVGSLDALRPGLLRGPQAQSATAPVAHGDSASGAPVSWTIAGAALLGGAGVSLFLRVKWGPVPSC